MSTNLIHHLHRQAIARPHQPALIDRHQTLSFAELTRSVGQAAVMLRSAGIAANDAALVFQPMSVELYVALLALFQLGAVAMFVDPAAGRAHLDRCCALYPPQALIASSKAHLLRLRSPALRQIPLKFVIGCPVPSARSWQTYRQQVPLEAIAPSTADSPALLTFTSGSTGQPKAALRTHGFLQAQHQVLAHSLGLQAGAIDFTTLPIFVLANLASGVTSLLPNVDLRFPGKVSGAVLFAQLQASQLQATAAHSTAASPALLDRLVAHCEMHKVQLPGLQQIFSGGAPVFPRLLERLQQVAPQANVTAVYGSTEAEPIAHIAWQQIQPADRQRMQQGGGLLVGMPVPEIQVRILSQPWQQPIAPLTLAELAAISLPAGEPGEIVVSGAHVLPGYWQGQGDAETKFRVAGQPWHRTGDRGYLDRQGRLWLLGRCRAAIQDEQGVLHPFAVETAISDLPWVRRSALVRHRDRRTLILELQPLSGAAQQQGLAEIKQRLGWANIQQIYQCASIPVDARHNAKIDYPALDRLLEQAAYRWLD